MGLKKRYSAAAHVPAIVAHCRRAGGVWTRHFRFGAGDCWVFYGPSVIRMDDASMQEVARLMGGWPPLEEPQGNFEPEFGRMVRVEA